VAAGSRAARIVAAIVGVRTKQLELQIRTNRNQGRLTEERRYRAGELHAALADLRAELEACEHEAGEGTSPFC
jgi:hypothetical protein